MTVDRLSSLETAFLAGNGEMAERIRALDWSSTPLGPMEAWPPGLRVVVDLMLGSPTPVSIVWGPERVQLYNDAYVPIAAERHPAALGRSTAETWSDAYEPFLGPVFDRVFAGETVTINDHAVKLRTPSGCVEERFFTGSFQPVRNGTGEVEGVFHPLIEVTAKVRADAELRERDARLRRVLDGMNEGFSLLAPDFRILEHNKAALRLDGRPREELIGRSHWEAYPGSEQSELGRLYKRAMAERVPVSLKHCFAFETGGARWLDVRAYPTDGGALAVFWRDVTASDAAEDALRESEARYRLLFDAIESGFCVVEVNLAASGGRVDYRVVEANPAFYQQTGFPPAILGRWLREAAPDLEEHWYETYGHVARTGEAVRFEQGSSHLGRWFDVSAFRISSPQQCRVAILFNDISARRSAEVALQESETRFRNVADHAPVMMWVTEADGRCTYLNRNWYAFTGQTPAEAEGFGWLDATHPDDREQAERVFIEANAKQAPFRLEYRLRRANGTYAWAIDAASPRFAPDGTFLGYVGSVIDIDERRRAETALRSTEERLRLAVENAEIGFWDVDVVNEELIWPPRTKALFGISPDVPVTMQDFYNGLHPDDRAETSEAFAAAADPARRALYDVEYRTIGKEDGLVRWVEAKGRGVFDVAGRCLRVAGTAVDITGRKAAEAALRESEARFRLMADAVPQIVWITDAEGRVEFFNKQWSDYTGAPFEHTTAAAVAANHVHPDDTPHTIAAFEEARRTGSTFLVEHRIRARSGDYRWFLVRGEPSRDLHTGEIARWFGASVDIHDRKLAEAALRELNETLEAQVAARSAERDRLWNLSQDMLARADYTGMMSAVSPAWTRVLGWSEHELLSRGYATFMHPDDMPPTIEAISRMAETNQPARFENRIGTKDGGWKHIEWTVAPEPDGVNFVAVGRDLSLTKAREAELGAAQEALRQAQKMEAMGQLTGGVAHDFNNLLTPIVGALDRLQRKKVGTEREQRLIAGAAQSAERAKVLVQRLLAFARRQPLQPVAVDVAKLVRNMADLVSSTTGPQIRVVVEAPEDMPPAKADPNQLEMALLNLAVNARDAMPEGGTLRISATFEAVRAEQRSDLKSGDYVKLSVADTGVGMDEATLARAVEPFFSTKGVGKGTGLGLSMVHGLASQLGGALRIKSRPGLGTNIELWLPQGGQNTETTGVTEPDELMSQNGRGTVLLVDDEELVRMSTAEMLSDLGYHVLEAGSAEEALRLIQTGLKVDLLVTDHLMPGMSGTELARALQAQSHGLPVLIVSGYAESEGVAPDLPRLAKPFREDELAASLAALVTSTFSGADVPSPAH